MRFGCIKFSCNMSIIEGKRSFNKKYQQDLWRWWNFLFKLNFLLTLITSYKQSHISVAFSGQEKCQGVLYGILFFTRYLEKNNEQGQMFISILDCKWMVWWDKMILTPYIVAQVPASASTESPWTMQLGASCHLATPQPKWSIQNLRTEPVSSTTLVKNYERAWAT